MKATNADKILIAALFILTAMSFNVRSYFNGVGSDALLYLDGKLTYKILLNDDGEHKIDVPNGTTTIKVSGGKLYITDAPCPLKICIHESPIFNEGDSLICVPNGLVVKINGGGGEKLDTVTK